ncbi:MAG: hypothetical protein FJX34_00350 [Alphaproteobacteria bacterium]|nr:hypothetical protein [Alphaproteobacteria bacterium]
MIKTIELIVAIILIISAFFAGVKYSDSIKSHASWLFENKGEEEVELPDLSNENGLEITAPNADDNMIEQNPSEPVQQDTVTPMDYIENNTQQPQP